jgi:hypothetical protein
LNLPCSLYKYISIYTTSRLCPSDFKTPPYIYQKTSSSGKRQGTKQLEVLPDCSLENRSIVVWQLPSTHGPCSPNLKGKKKKADFSVICLDYREV